LCVLLRSGLRVRLRGTTFLLRTQQKLIDSANDNFVSVTLLKKLFCLGTFHMARSSSLSQFNGSSLYDLHESSLINTSIMFFSNARSFSGGLQFAD
jgi:hypothetical protein